MSQTSTDNEPRSASVEPTTGQVYAGPEQVEAAAAKIAIAGQPARQAQIPVPDDPWLALAGLVVLGGISGIAYYLGFIQPYQLGQYYVTPLLDLAKINGHTPNSANAWAFTWIVLAACYFAAFRLCPSGEGVTRLFRRFALGLICVWAAFFAFNLLYMYPVGAADLFDQIFRARLTAHYAIQPVYYPAE